MKDLLKLTDMEFDALKEMGNIGAGHIATAISKMLGKDVDINIPETKFVDIQDFAEYLGGPEKIVSAIYVPIEGTISGEAIFIFPEQGSLELIDLLLGQEKGTTKRIDEDTLEESAFKEISNILTGSFLNSLSKMLDAKIMPQPPHIATDMVQAIIDLLLINVGSYASSILSVSTKIDVMGHDINGKFLILFDKDSLLLMLDRLHEKFG